MAYQKFLKQIHARWALPIFLMAAFFMGYFDAIESFAWLVFHKPEFKGKIIEAQSNEPIEGVVVVALYNTRSIIGGPAGVLYKKIHMKEVLTDENGEFLIPAYTAVMGPNSHEDRTEFIIYKAGYGGYPLNRPSDFEIVGPEEFFSKEIGTKGETYWGTQKGKGPDGTIWIRPKSFLFTYGLVKLRSLNTKEERLKAVPRRPVDTTLKELPLLYKEINNERKLFGLKPVGGQAK